MHFAFLLFIFSTFTRIGIFYGQRLCLFCSLTAVLSVFRVCSINLCFFFLSFFFFFFFLMWTTFKVFTEFVTILFLFCFGFFGAQDKCDLSSPTRDRTHIPCIGRDVLTSGPLERSQSLLFEWEAVMRKRLVSFWVPGLYGTVWSQSWVKWHQQTWALS